MEDFLSKKIVIVGGGYVGFEVAQGLESSADVTLIEQREAFMQPPAAIRALVDQSLLKDLILPYDRLLSRGKVMRGKVVSIQQDGVMLADGTKVEADYVIVATGSSYAAPFKPAGETIDEFVEASNLISKKLVSANSVVIVGAGAVGTELAGEIAAAQPGKEITLISSDQTLFPAYTPKLGKRLRARLESSGVTVRLGQRVVDLKTTDQPYEGAITLADGTRIDADLIFPVIGSKPQAEILTDLPGVKFDRRGRVNTDAWLRPSDYENVFVAGDIACTGDGMTIVAISRQNPWLIKALKAVLAGKSVEDFKPYEPWKKAPILLPLGPRHGSSWLFMVMGDFVTRAMKGKTLFIPKYRKAFGYVEK